MTGWMWTDTRSEEESKAAINKARHIELFSANVRDLSYLVVAAAGGIGAFEIAGHLVNQNSQPPLAKGIDIAFMAAGAGMSMLVQYGLTFDSAKIHDFYNNAGEALYNFFHHPKPKQPCVEVK